MQLDTGAFARYGEPIITIDSHTAGEPTRVVVGGLPPLPGATINEKRLTVSERLDHVRLLLTREPRGHRDMFAAIATDPVNPEGDFGLIFMDAMRYPYMCGHGTIGAVTTFIEMGWLDVPPGAESLDVVVDTPSGPVRAHARLRHSAGGVRVESVAIQLESAYALPGSRRVTLPTGEAFDVEVAFAGGFFAMISADQVDLPLTAENAPALARLGMALIDAADAQLDVQHPTRDYIRSIDVAEFYAPDGHPPNQGRNAVVYGDYHVDRSPCGTGTSAKMALLHHRGLMQTGDTLINEGLLDTTFAGCIVRETTVGDQPAIVPEIRGAAHVTGLHRFVVQGDDPFPRGFLF